NPNVLEIAQASCRDWPEIRLQQADVLDLPYNSGSFDLVLCSLALHHFGWGHAVQILRRMQDLARIGYLLNDLRRNWASIWITELLARTIIRSSIVRQDAPQSCQAAFTLEELRALAAQAKLSN